MKTLVVAKYNEDTKWTRDFENVEIIHKGVDLPNFGREQHTFLWYIVNNYEELNGYYFFVQGNPFDHCEDLKEVYETRLEKKWTPLGKKLGSKKGERICELDGRPHHGTGNLKIKEFLSDIGINYNRNLIKFYAGGQYSIHSSEIKKKPKEYYEKVLNLFDKYGEKAGYILERVMQFVFNWKEFEHYVVTRFAYPTNYPYFEERKRIFKLFLIECLKEQTNKNFKFIIIGNDKTHELEEELKGINYQILHEGLGFVKEKPLEVFDLQCNYLITTRFDDDDLVHPEFVGKIQELFKKLDYLSPYVIDFKGFRYDMRNRKAYKVTEYDPRTGWGTSPFLTFVEKADIENIKTCVYLKHGHMGHNFHLHYVDQEYWIQVAHHLNISNNKLPRLFKYPEVKERLYFSKYIKFLLENFNLVDYSDVVITNEYLKKIKKEKDYLDKEITKEK